MTELDTSKGPGKRPGKEPGEEQGKGPGREPGEGQGKGPGREPGEGQGKGPGREPGEEQGKRPRVIRAGVMPAEARGPRAFVADDGAVRIEEGEDVFAAAAALPSAAPARRSSAFAMLVWSAFLGLATLWTFDSALNWGASLAARKPWLGRVALGLIGVLALGLMVFLLREGLALLRLRKAAALRARAEALLLAPEAGAARAFARDLAAFYRHDTAATAGRAEVARTLEEVHDAPTFLAVAERALLVPKDAAARALIARAAERVSVVTALSPRVLVDVLVVLVQSVVLIRQISTLYGGRATGLGLLKLSARVFGYLALSGSFAVAGEMASQMLGAGLAARLSARLGEGVLCGVLCARAGIAAVALVRPMPHREAEPIQLSQVVKISLTQSKVEENTAV